MKTTIGRLAFDSIFPPGYTDEYPQDKPIGNKEIGDLLQRLAEEHPEKYREVSHKVLRLGAKTSVETGSSFSLKDLRWPVDKAKFMAAVEKEESAIFNDKKLSKIEKEKELIKLLNANAMKMPDITFQQGMESGSTLAKMVASGARGNKSQLNANVAASFLVVDQNNKPVPVGIKSSFAEGQKLHEYLAGGYGVRAGTIAGKFAVRDSGYLSKQIGSVSMDMLVTESDCSTKNGISVPVDDKDSVGSILARDTSGYKSGTIITPKILKDMQGRKTENIVVRSAMTCQAGNGGICAHCAGIREKNKLPRVGDNIGLTSASSLGEPLSQALLGAKHSLMYTQQVLMADLTSKQICDIQIGDFVMGSNKSGELAPAKVLEVIYHGKEPVYQYDYRMGDTKHIVSIDCTDAHVLLCYLGNTLVQLQSGDPISEVGVPMPVSYNKEGYREELSMLYGVLMGSEIEWINDTEFLIKCDDDTLIEDLANYDIEFYKTLDGAYLLNSSISEDDKTRITQCGVIDKDRNHRGISRALVSGWDKHSLANLLAGYLAVAGKIKIYDDKTCSISFGTTSHTLIDEIQFIIEKIFCCYGSGKTLEPYDDQQDVWYYTIDRVDQIKKLLSQLPTISGHQKKQAEIILGISDKEIQYPPFYACPRIGKQFIGNEPCFDLTIDNEDNLFVTADGIITHNSSGSVSAKKVTGFRGINALFQIPDVYPNKAILAELDGEVTQVEDLPQGGKNIYIGNTAHYVAPDADVLIKPGMKLEAGDKITDGDINPADISRLRGLGEGRMSFVKGIKDIFNQNGVNVNRRNAEVVAKAVVDHVKVVDPEETSEYLPDDIVRYSDFEKSYQPRDNSYKSAPKTSVGKYLEAPALHYTIGTKITPRIADTLDRNGDTDLLVNDEEPTFVSNMVRVMDAPSYNGNWMAQLGTSYIQKNLKKNVLQTSESDIHGQHPLPALAYGKEFGQSLPGKVGY